MGSAALDATLEQRLQDVVATLGATVAVDCTIGVDMFARSSASVVLPLLSIDAESDGESGRVLSSGAPADLQVRGLLGAGGMGAVYAARQRALDRDVALKRPLAADTSDASSAALMAEGRVMGSLEHPNIVPVHALGRDADGLPVLVMKRIEGASWRDLLRNPDHPMWDRLGTAKARGLAFHVDVLMGVCNALHFAHSRGVVHRDVKPENVMVGAFGEVYLLDWGIALSPGRTSSQLAGTPAYMAPEMVIDPSSADARTDVYLLGATLHEVLVGRPLHEGATLAAVLRSLLDSKPFAYPASVPSDLAELVVAATAADRERRPPSAAAFRDVLAEYVAHRASQELATSALAKLADAQALVHGAADALDGSAVGALLSEARFGLEQSLREWSDNAVARDGLVQCLTLLFERKIGQRNAAGARAILGALPTPIPALEQRVVELERSIASSRALDAAAAERARQMDASVAARPRILLMAGLLIVGGGLSVGAYLDEQRTGEMISMADQLRLDAGALSVVAVGLALARRKLLANAYNRRLWLLWVVVIVGILAVDAFFWHRGYDAWSATAVDFFLLALVFGTGAAMFSPPLGWVALTGLAVSVISVVKPSVSTPAATLGLFVMIAIIVEQARRSAVAAADAAKG